MGVFENYKEIDGRVVDTSFIQWIHEGIPNEPESVRLLLRIWASLS